MSDEVSFRQYLSGRDHARGDDVARAMRNFTYVIGDRRSGEALIVDPAYDVAGLTSLVEDDGLRLVGVLATHYHADHVGGPMMGHALEGVAELRQRVGVPVHVHEDELDWIRRGTGLAASDFVTHADGDVIPVGRVEVRVLHTPGHTPGSACYLVDGRLLSGDTLFLEGCGRTDLPGGDAAALYRSLHERLATVDDDVELFPGHLYSTEPSLPLGEVRRRNVVLAPIALEAWLGAFGS